MVYYGCFFGGPGWPAKKGAEIAVSLIVLLWAMLKLRAELMKRKQQKGTDQRLKR